MDVVLISLLLCIFVFMLALIFLEHLPPSVVRRRRNVGTSWRKWESTAVHARGFPLVYSSLSRWWGLLSFRLLSCHRRTWLICMLNMLGCPGLWDV